MNRKTQVILIKGAAAILLCLICILSTPYMAYAVDNDDGLLTPCGYMESECVEIPDEEATQHMAQDFQTVYNAAQKTGACEDFDWGAYSSSYYYEKLDDNFRNLWGWLYETAYVYASTDKDFNRVNSIVYTDLARLDEFGIENCTRDELFKAVNQFIYDNPQFYFVRGMTYSRDSDGYVISAGLTVYPDFEYGSDRQKATEEFIAAVNGLKAKIDYNMSYFNNADTYDVISEIHDTVCDYVSYDYQTINREINQSVYSALIDNSTVCAGYAKEFQMLATYYGIESVVVTSSTHMWNIVKLSDNWYVVDTTWDDQTGCIMYSCNMSSYEYIENKYSNSTDHVYSDYCSNEAPQVSQKVYADVTVKRENSPVITSTADENGSYITIEAQPYEGNVYYTADGRFDINNAQLYENTFSINKSTQIVAQVAVTDDVSRKNIKNSRYEYESVAAQEIIPDDKYYEGDMNTELLEFKYDEETGYLSGKIVAVLWIDSDGDGIKESHVPEYTPVMSFEAVDGTESIDVFVTSEGTNTYYFDRKIASLTENKEYIFKISDADIYNKSEYKGVPVYTGTSNVGDSGVLGKAEGMSIAYKTAGDGTLILYGTKSGSDKGTDGEYCGDINSLLTDAGCIKNELGSFVSGHIIITEWIDGKSVVPQTTPSMTFEAYDGTEKLSMYVVSEGTNTYYFDRNLSEDMDTSKEYIFRVSLTGENNVSDRKSMIVTTNYMDNKEGVLWETDTQYVCYKTVAADGDNQLRVYAVQKNV